MLWNDDYIVVEDIHHDVNSLSTTITIKDRGSVCRLMAVYGPSRDRDKPAFFEQIKSLKPPTVMKWMVLGDFNVIYRVCDKNNGNIDRRWMGQFRVTLNDCELKEIHFQNRKFMWSNEREIPMLVKLDRVFLQ